jgi:hypothetical protein
MDYFRDIGSEGRCQERPVLPLRIGEEFSFKKLVKRSTRSLMAG